MIPIDFDIIVFEEKDVYISYCPELDVSSCGDSISNAKEMLKEAIRLFLEEVEKMGTLETILEESNYTKNSDGRWIPPKLVDTELSNGLI